MFANITVSEVVVAILAILAGAVTFFKSAEYLLNKASKAFSKVVSTSLEPTNAKIDSLVEDVEKVREQALSADLAACKNFLVRFLADIEQGQPVDEVERMRFWETYEHYRSLGQNSYIQEKVANLKAQGKL